MKIACENIDRLVSVGIRPPGMPRSAMNVLYEEAKGENPISYDIAQELLARRDAKVAIFTGATVPDHLPNGENDGPMGAIILARALEKLGVDTTVFTEIEVLGPQRAFAELVGSQVPIVELLRDSASQHSAIAADYDIAITVEKAGGNREGLLHSINANPRSHTRANIDGVINSMNAAGKLTVGIGDGGNEIGFGKVYDVAAEILPYGDTIVTTVATTYLYPVAISNWGAYALAAALAIGADRTDLVITPEEEEAMLNKAVELDCRDGGTGTAAFAVDGVSGASSMAYVQLLREVVTATLTPYTRDF
jgi:hypothetical protein